LINYQVTQIKKLPVEVELSREATAQDIVKFGAESVILATGARQENLHVPGANGRSVMTAVNLLSNKTGVGKSVLVMGGGLIGCETAVYLAQNGHQVTITTRRASILTDMIHNNRLMLIKMMADSNVQVLSNTWPIEVIAGGIIVKQDGEGRILPVESLVFSGGMRSCNELEKALTGRVTELYAIGDCVEPRRIINAIWEAFHTARKIEA